MKYIIILAITALILISCSKPAITGKFMADVSKEMDSGGLIVLFEFQKDSVVAYNSFINGDDTSTEQAFTGSYRVDQNTVVINYRDAVGDNTFKLLKRNNDTLVEKGASSQIVYVKFE
jgi:hypothetical protein